MVTQCSVSLHIKLITLSIFSGNGLLTWKSWPMSMFKVFKAHVRPKTQKVEQKTSHFFPRCSLRSHLCTRIVELNLQIVTWFNESIQRPAIDIDNLWNIAIYCLHFRRSPLAFLPVSPESQEHQAQSGYAEWPARNLLHSPQRWRLGSKICATPGSFHSVRSRIWKIRENS